MPSRRSWASERDNALRRRRRFKVKGRWWTAEYGVSAEEVASRATGAPIAASDRRKGRKEVAALTYTQLKHLVVSERMDKDPWEEQVRVAAHEAAHMMWPKMRHSEVVEHAEVTLKILRHLKEG